MTNWEHFYPHILTDVPGAPVPVINQKLCLAAREFCRRTAAWTEWNDPIYPTDGQTLDFDAFGGQEVVRIVRATRGDSEINMEVWSEDKRPVALRPLRFLDRIITSKDRKSYTVYLRNAGDSLSMLVAYMPTLDATGVGDSIAELYAEKVALGAKALLQMMPRQEFSDPGMAAVNQQMFQRSIHLVANEPFAARTQKKTAKAAL